MKKFLKITAVIIVSLLIFFVGTFKYRQYKANQTTIPQNAVSLVKINIDEIYKTLALNIISNPVYYFKSDLNKNPKSKYDNIDYGLKIPASIYFYTIKGQPETSLFSRFEIKNLGAFENFLKTTLQVKVEKKQEGINHAQSKLGNFIIYYKNNAAAIVLTPQSGNFEQILLDILNQKNFKKIDNTPFKKLLKKTEHLAFNNANNNGWIDFGNGFINFENEFISDEIVLKDGAKSRELNKNATINFWFNADLKSNGNKIYKYKNLSLERDSLLKYYNGYLDFEWTDSKQQTDSIVTYEYNDDFEKVEKVSFQKRNIPLFSLNIETERNGLKNYLAKQDFLNLDSNIISKTIFPLYNIHFNSTAEHLTFSTEKNTSNANKVPTTDFLYLNVNFIKLTEQMDLPIVTNYLKNLKQLELNGNKTIKDKASLQGKLEFKNESINSLYQLLKSF